MNAEQLAAELIALERQAGRVGVLLQQAGPELVEHALEAFGPKPVAHRREVWRRYWLGWIDRCAEQLEHARPAWDVPPDQSQVNQPETWTRPEPLLRTHQNDGIVGLMQSTAEIPVVRPHDSQPSN